MPIINSISDFKDTLTTWRRQLHQNPELGFDCHNISSFVADRLRDFGVDEIHDGLAQTGLVGIIHGQSDGPTIGLRADMDALPITEETGAEWQSTVPGKMHACGHDGHTVMLLGAAKYLTETRNFAGRVALIFQPAEENGGGADVMIKDGLLEKFGITQVYALHNAPGVPEGHFHTTPGPIMAAVDTFEIHVQGVGGHGAMPHETKDPIPAAIGIVQAIQTISSRNNHALDNLVISVTQIHTGTAENIVPDKAFIGGTVRTFDPKVQTMVQNRMAEIVAGQAASFGVTAKLDYQTEYPATINHAEQAAFAAEVAREISGNHAVQDNVNREMGAEDFAFMLQKCPGAYLFLGQGDSAGLHHPAYDFNDDIAPIGASFFARLAERALPVGVK